MKYETFVAGEDQFIINVVFSTLCGMVSAAPGEVNNQSLRL
jgi:hypothetical protein